MKKITLVIAMVCLLFSYKSYSETLKSKICTDCSFQEAKTLALTIDKPILECFTVSYGGNSMRRCYTKEKKTVLIGNYTNKQVYAFELVHANQGNSSDSHILANSIAYDSVQNQVNSLLDIMEIYQDITNFSNQQKQSVISLIQQTRQYSIQRSESSSNSCDESSIEARAVDLAYDSDVRTTWQKEAQNLYDTNPRYAATFKGTKMNGATFTVGTGNFSITGSWVTTDVMPRVEVPLYLNADVPSDAEYIVGYRLSINSGKVKLNLDPLTTYFQGRNLEQWMNSGIATNTSNCLLKQLNEHRDAAVRAASQYMGGTGDYDVQLPPANYSYTIGGGSGGTGSRINSQRCKWTFYDLFGSPMYQTYGSCP